MMASTRSFAGMHVVTAIGYDDAGVYVMDPAKGSVDHYDWATFSDMWALSMVWAWQSIRSNQLR